MFFPIRVYGLMGDSYDPLVPGWQMHEESQDEELGG